jgi:aspartate racemase
LHAPDRITDVKLLGAIGGVGPESTVDFYRRFLTAYRARVTDGSYPPIVINSIDLARAVALVTETNRKPFVKYLVDELGRLARAGCDLGVLTANTPHIVFDEVRKKSPLPLLSIVEVTRDEAAKQKMKKLALFGTRFTMQGGFFQDVFARAGMEIVLPESTEQEEIHGKYMSELVNGVFRPGTRDRFVTIAQRLRSEERVDGLILGGTELPLLLREAEGLNVPLLDTTQLLVERSLEEILA